MINHARTLLLNRQANFPGHYRELGEYVPPNYEPLKLPGYLQRIRQQLFGSNPDRLYAEYRTRQYITILHSTEFAGEMTRWDSRITYDPTTNSTDLLLDRDGLCDTQYLSFVGDVQSEDNTGLARHEWLITRAPHGHIKIVRTTEPAETIARRVTIHQHLSELLPLPGTEAQFRFRDSLPVEDTQHVVADVKPRRSLPEIVAAISAGEFSDIWRLFHSPKQLPGDYQSWENLWLQHDELAYKLTGLLLAVIWRAEERRQYGE